MSDYRFVELSDQDIASSDPADLQCSRGKRAWFAPAGAGGGKIFRARVAKLLVGVFAIMGMAGTGISAHTRYLETETDRMIAFADRFVVDTLHARGAGGATGLPGSLGVHASASTSRLIR